MNGDIGDLSKTHKLAPINNDKVPIRYLLGIKRLDGKITTDELIYTIVTQAFIKPADMKIWPEGATRAIVPLKINNLTWLGRNMILDGHESANDSIKTLVELKYIIKNGSNYRIVNHPWV